jgi:hypothetical protein
MEYGQLGGLNYEINFPQQQQRAIDPGAMAEQAVQYRPMAPQKDQLAVREKLTGDYYNNYAALENFAKEMSAQGIDPFKPDFSQDGGGSAHQIFQKMQANLMYAANALKNEYEAEKDVRQQEMSGAVRMKPGVSREGMYYSDPNNFFSTKLPQGVEETNQRLAQETNDPTSQNRANQLLTQEVAKIDQQVQQGYMSPEEGEYFKNQLVENKWRTQPFAPRVDKDDDRGAKYASQVALLRKYTNLKNGVWPEGAYSKTTTGGKVYLKNEDGKGDVLGKYESGLDKNGAPILKDKVVDSWMKDPETGKVYVKYTDPNIPMEEVSNQPGDALTRTFVSNNSKYGSVDKIMEAATALALTDEKGSSIDEMLMPQDYKDTQFKVRESGLQESAEVKKRMKNLRKQLSGVKDPFMAGNNWIEYDLPNGKVAQIAKHRGKNQYYIKNKEELGFDTGVENLSEDEVFELLDDSFNYSSKFLNAPQQPTTQQPTSQKSQISERQQKAISAFTQQFGRQPSETEKQKLLSKYQ